VADNAIGLEAEARSTAADDIHRTVSADGTAIAGTVHGQGPPLVLVHAGLGSGTLDWSFALPFLRDQFTCYCMSTRGRGPSADHADQSFARGVEDVVAFVESIGEPVGLAGPSGGAMFVLGAAARTDAVAAVAACDPLVFELLTEEDATRLHDAVERMAGLAGEGRLREAARDWMLEWANSEEMTAMAKSGYLDACAQYVQVLLRALQQAEEDSYSPTDPSVLSQIRVPVLIIQGADAQSVWPWFTTSVRYVADHVADPHVRTVAGAGHMGAWVKPRAYADELVRFFGQRLRPEQVAEPS
jgi:pimeloyl-ACP methyl ester carboxylesterase